MKVNSTKHFATKLKNYLSAHLGMLNSFQGEAVKGVGTKRCQSNSTLNAHISVNISSS